MATEFHGTSEIVVVLLVPNLGLSRGMCNGPTSTTLTVIVSLKLRSWLQSVGGHFYCRTIFYVKPKLRPEWKPLILAPHFRPTLLSMKIGPESKSK